VGVETSYGLENRGSIPCMVKILLFSVNSRPAVGPTQSIIQKVPGALSPGLKRAGRETEHSPLSSVEIKKGGAMPPLPHMSSRHNA
jgi:hypothetical protein